MSKQVNVNWSKWNRDQFWQSIKCFFGFHKLIQHSEFNVHTGPLDYKECSECERIFHV